MSVVGDNIKKYRELKKLTQQEVADYLGVKKSAVCNWEKGLNGPVSEKIERLLEILDVDANTLFGWKNKKQLKADADNVASELVEKVQTLDEGGKAFLMELIERMK